jgi:hypothetical protein
MKTYSLIGLTLVIMMSMSIGAPRFPQASTTSTQSNSTDLVLPLTWERSAEASDSVPYGSSPGSAVTDGLALPLDPDQTVFDNGEHTPAANISATPIGNEWASWPQYHGSCRSTFEVRRLRAAFTVVEDVDSVVDLVLFSPYYTEQGDIIPINDNVYVFLNGTLIGQNGGRYGASNAGTNGTAPFANETDGWYQDGSFGPAAVDALQPGTNVLDLIGEEQCKWGGIGRLELKLMGVRVQTSIYLPVVMVGR